MTFCRVCRRVLNVGAVCAACIVAAHHDDEPPGRNPATWKISAQPAEILSTATAITQSSVVTGLLGTVTLRYPM